MLDNEEGPSNPIVQNVVLEKSTVNAFVQDKLNSERSGSTNGHKYVPFSARGKSRGMLSDLTVKNKKVSKHNNFALEMRNLYVENRQKPPQFKDAGYIQVDSELDVDALEIFSNEAVN